MQHCSKCGLTGHKANRCLGKTSAYKQKFVNFVNFHTLGQFYKIRDYDDDDAEVRDPWEEDHAEDEVENVDGLQEQ